MMRILYYLQHYLSPSMTFTYLQLLGVSKNFSTTVICSRKKENIDVFPYESLYYFPASHFQIMIAQLNEKIKFRAPKQFVNINPFLFRKQKEKISTVIESKKINLIHAHFGPSGIEILQTAKKLNIPLLVTFHGYDIYALLIHKKYIEHIKKLYEYAGFIVVSKNMKLRLKNIFGDDNRIHVIHCGIPLNVFSFAERESIKQKKVNNKLISFLQVSNFVEKKGQKYTVLAFSKFLESYPNANLIFAGDGPLESDIKNLCKDLNINEKVKFLGHIKHSEVFNLMKKADVFLHHSIVADNGDQEGIPTTIMEAMATGLPVISTIHSGIPELIDDGINGHLVKEKDIVAYAKKMSEILLDNGEIGANARRKIESDFNLEIQNKKIEELYSKILGQ